MPNYPISNVTRRVVYTGSAGVGPYAFSFEIISNTDVAVYKNDVLLTLTTNYSVTINANGTGSVTLVVAATGADNITVVGARAVERTTDFSTGGDLFANTINQELDSETILIQQVAESNDRAIKAPVTDPTTINMTLPAKATRANKLLAFDANGNPIADQQIGTNRGNWAAATVYYVRDLVKDTSNNNIYQCIVAHTSSGAQPISTNTDVAKWSLVVDAASAATSASAAATSASAASTSASNASTSASNASTSASNASTSASSAASAQASAESARDSALSAYDNFDDRYLGSKTAAPTLDNDGNALLAGALYFNSVTGVMNVYTGSAWVAAYVSGTGFLSVSNNLSELTATASTARTNIGLGTAATMTGPSGTIVGTTDSQTLTNKTLTAPVISSISNTGTLTLPTSTDTLVGKATTDTLTNKTLTNPTVTSYVETVVAIGTVTTSSTLSLTNGTVQTATLTASTACTFTMPTATAGKSFVLLLKQAATTGNGTATFTSVKFGTAGAPTITATAGKMDILTFVSDGTNWYGSIAQGYTP